MQEAIKSLGYDWHVHVVDNIFASTVIYTYMRVCIIVLVVKVFQFHYQRPLVEVFLKPHSKDKFQFWLAMCYGSYPSDCLCVKVCRGSAYGNTSTSQLKTMPMHSSHC